MEDAGGKDIKNLKETRTQLMVVWVVGGTVLTFIGLILSMRATPHAALAEEWSHAWPYFILAVLGALVSLGGLLELNRRLRRQLS